MRASSLPPLDCLVQRWHCGALQSVVFRMPTVWHASSPQCISSHGVRGMLSASRHDERNASTAQPPSAT